MEYKNIYNLLNNFNFESVLDCIEVLKKIIKNNLLLKNYKIEKINVILSFFIVIFKKFEKKNNDFNDSYNEFCNLIINIINYIGNSFKNDDKLKEITLFDKNSLFFDFLIEIDSLYRIENQFDDIINFLIFIDEDDNLDLSNIISFELITYINYKKLKNIKNIDNIVYNDKFNKESIMMSNTINELFDFFTKISDQLELINTDLIQLKNNSIKESENKKFQYYNKALEELNKKFKEIKNSKDIDIRINSLNLELTKNIEILSESISEHYININNNFNKTVDELNLDINQNFQQLNKKLINWVSKISITFEKISQKNSNFNKEKLVDIINSQMDNIFNQYDLNTSNYNKIIESKIEYLLKNNTSNNIDKDIKLLKEESLFTKELCQQYITEQFNWKIEKLLINSNNTINDSNSKYIIWFIRNLDFSSKKIYYEVFEKLEKSEYDWSEKNISIFKLVDLINEALENTDLNDYLPIYIYLTGLLLRNKNVCNIFNENNFFKEIFSLLKNKNDKIYDILVLECICNYIKFISLTEDQLEIIANYLDNNFFKLDYENYIKNDKLHDRTEIFSFLKKEKENIYLNLITILNNIFSDKNNGNLFLGKSKLLITLLIKIFQTTSNVIILKKLIGFVKILLKNGFNKLFDKRLINSIIKIEENYDDFGIKSDFDYIKNKLDILN